MPRKIPPPSPFDDNDIDDEDRDYLAERYVELMSDYFGHSDYFRERVEITDPHNVKYLTTEDLASAVEELERNGKDNITGRYGLGRDTITYAGYGLYWYH